MMRFQMTMRAAVVRVRRTELHVDEVQAPVTNTALGDDLLGELAHPFDGPVQEDRLDTLVVVQMRVHGGNGELMVRVLNTRQALRQFALVMIVNIRQIGHTESTRVAPLGTVLQVCAQNVADGFAAVGVPTFLDELIEGTG